MVASRWASFPLPILLLALSCKAVTGKEEPRPPSSVPLDQPEEKKVVEDGYVREDGVYVLTDGDLDSFIEKNPSTLVEFYAPWCGHCKQLAPEYSKAAALLEAGGEVSSAYTRKVKLAKVDATVEKELAKRFDVSGYPTLKFWRKGLKGPVDYDGERTAAGIIKWLEERANPRYKPPPEAVVTLTVETFDEFIGDKPIMLVEFYAPWCGHCKKLTPEYEKAAQKLKAHDIPLAKVDATVEKKLSDQYGVQGFPTLKILRMGRRFDYEGPRDADGIVKYMLEQAEPAAKELNNVQEVKKFMNQRDVTVLGFFSSPSGALYDAFIEAAERTRGDFTTGLTTSAEVAKHYKVKPDRVVLFYPEVFWSAHEPRSRSYENAGATAEELLAFYREWATPLVGQKTRMNSATRYSKLPLVVVYYNVDFSPAYRDGTQYWRQKVLEAAHKHRASKFRFAIADEEEFQQELTDLGLGDSGLEHNVVVFGIDGKRYTMPPEEFDGDLEENLDSFLALINKGKAKPYVKSAPPPKDDRGPVKAVVASNFDKIVNDEEKDVLIEFYAPWCGHCKAFEPQYKQFATLRQREEPNFLVAKMDATLNDAPEPYKVEGFPTIYFAPAGKEGKPIKYSGNREPNDLLAFVKKHAVKSFQGGAKKEEL